MQFKILRWIETHSHLRDILLAAQRLVRHLLEILTYLLRRMPSGPPIIIIPIRVHRFVFLISLLTSPLALSMKARLVHFLRSLMSPHRHRLGPLASVSGLVRALQNACNSMTVSLKTVTAHL